jgi:hypothetical protein
MVDGDITRLDSICSKKRQCKFDDLDLAGLRDLRGALKTVKKGK